MTTLSVKPQEVQQDWYVVDATGKVLGRMVTEIARRLRGKHKPQYTSHVDTGDYIIVINAAKVRVTGRKGEQKTYYRHTEYPGGIKTETFDQLINRDPVKIIELAVKGMLPKGPLGYAMLKKLRVYSGASHQHAPQQPQTLEF